MRLPTRYIPRFLKNCVPGYRRHWRRNYGALLHGMQECIPTLAFGETDGVPWVQVRGGGPRLHGFWTEADDAELYDNLRPDLPRTLPRPYFRLVRDYLTRYCYPHMRPDLKPLGFPVTRMGGFHGQHKDAIADLIDADDRERLIAAFRPGRDDITIDCGAFLGFGALRLAADTPEGMVVAVEASAACHALLERNVAHNGAGNVVPVRRGIWSTGSIRTLESSYAQANSLVPEVHTGDHTVSVETTNIDSLAVSLSLARVDMISLTINGAEPEALAGAAKTLAVHRPRIRLAGWYRRDGRLISSICSEFLVDFDYDVFVGGRGSTLALPR